jgi:TonB family protein
VSDIVLLLAAALTLASCASTHPTVTTTAKIEVPEQSGPILTVADWARVLQAKIEHSWTRPKGFDRGIDCRVKLTLNEQGDLQDVALLKSCGSDLYDSSIIAAAHRASPLPVPDNPAIFDKTLILVLMPQ